jgi:anti-sigma-K factor RskA
MIDDQIQDDDMLAAEYALGLLMGADLADAQRRLANDQAFARLVTAWEVRLTQLTDDVAPQQPSPATKKLLLGRMFPDTRRPSFWQGVRIWQAVSAVCLLWLGILGVTNLYSPNDFTAPLYTAEIVAQAGDFRVIAVVDKSTDEVILTKILGAAPEGRILQVWAHGEGEPAISVGLWPEGESIRLALPPTIAAVQGVLTLGISEEPVGGSPTGSPTGRVFGTVDIAGVLSAL